MLLVAVALCATACDFGDTPVRPITHHPATTVERHKTNPKTSIGFALTCYKVNRDSDLDPIRAKGYVLTFRGGTWYLGSEVVGHADHEDDPFALCTRQVI
jgi:hypothetical protein